MRYDKAVYFVKTEKTYDASTGDYSLDPVKTKQWASIMDATRSVLQEIYGGFRKGVLVIHLLSHYNDPFDYIEVNGHKYQVDDERRLRTKHTFVVSEVRNGH